MDRSRTRRPMLFAALGAALTAAAGFAAFAPAALAQTETPPPPRSSTTNRARTEEASLGFKGIGGRIGLVKPEGASSTVDLGIHVDAGEFVHNVHLTPMAEYWKVGVAGLDFKDFAISTDVTVDFPLQDSRMTPYVGGGLGVHWFSSDAVDLPNDTKLGIDAVGGIRTDAMPNLALFGELRYNFVSDVNQLKILGGLTYRFIY